MKETEISARSHLSVFSVLSVLSVLSLPCASALTNNSSEDAYLSGVTVVGKDGTQVELDDLVGLLNETDDSNPDAYSAGSNNAG